MQLFDFKTTYRFQTTPGIDQYNMPLYNIQSQAGVNDIYPFPVYQGFLPGCTVNGVEVPFYTQRQEFFNAFSNYTQSLTQVGTGDGTTGPYTLTLPYSPVLPGHIDMAGIAATQANPIADPPFVASFLTTVPTTSVESKVYFNSVAANGQIIQVADSGQFLTSGTAGELYGLLMTPGAAPLGNTALVGGYSTTLNTINYATGTAVVTFDTAIPSGTSINAQCYFYNQGMPNGILFHNNTITMRPPSNISYLIELQAYLSPSAFLVSGDAIPFGYMAEYISRGAARKMLSDTGDVEQFMFYEPLFKEQEMLVWKRSQRQFTSTRVPTIFSSPQGSNSGNNTGQGIY